MTTSTIRISFPELVDAYISRGEAMMTASSGPAMLQEEQARHEILVTIRECEQAAGFPDAADAAAFARLKEWEALHGVPRNEEA